jgi:hypothetical protein
MLAVPGVLAVVAFEEGPAEVLTAAAAGGLVVDFLGSCLAHVANAQVAGGAVEAQAPRIAKPVRPDFAAGPGLGHERIRFGSSPEPSA